MKRKRKEGQIVNVYLVKKFMFGENDEPELSLKIGSTEDEFFGSGKRGSSYDTECGPESRGYKLVRIVKSPDVLEDMFHLKYKHLRLINKRTGKLNEWMTYSESIIDEFVNTEDVLSRMCDDFEENWDTYFTNDYSWTEAKIKKFLRDRREKRFLEEKRKLSEAAESRYSPDKSLVLKVILEDNISSGLELIKTIDL